MDVHHMVHLVERLLRCECNSVAHAHTHTHRQRFVYNSTQVIASLISFEKTRNNKIEWRLNWYDTCGLHLL